MYEHFRLHYVTDNKFQATTPDAAVWGKEELEEFKRLHEVQKVKDTAELSSITLGYARLAAGQQPADSALFSASGRTRAQMIDYLDRRIDAIDAALKSYERGESDLFGLLVSTTTSGVCLGYVVDWARKILCAGPQWLAHSHQAATPASAASAGSGYSGLQAVDDLLADLGQNIQQTQVRKAREYQGFYSLAAMTGPSKYRKRAALGKLLDRLGLRYEKENLAGGEPDAYHFTGRNAGVPFILSIKINEGAHAIGVCYTCERFGNWYVLDPNHGLYSTNDAGTFDEGIRQAIQSPIPGSTFKKLSMYRVAR